MSTAVPTDSMTRPHPSIRIRLWAGLLAILVGASAASAADPYAPAGTSLVRLPIPAREQLHRLHQLGIEPEDADRDSMSFRVTSNQLAFMQELGLQPVAWDGPRISPEMEAAYTSYAQMVAELNQTVADHPLITQLTSIGQTVQGREIWAIKLTDHPEVEEFEPEVRICGAHHGNEKMSVEVCLNLVAHLTDNYGSDPVVTALVDGREIWVIPMVNPDGVEANSRYNSHSVDLNRNYGYMWEGGGSSAFSEPETQAMRDLATDNLFVTSLSFHTSGDIVNSIWNYSPIYTEDDAAVWEITSAYAASTGYWGVRGWYWYETHGDCNDWSYGARGDLDWTIEVSNSNESAVWNLNREPALYVIDAAGWGLHGIVTDAVSGEPLRARISVEGLEWTVFTDPVVGDYHRVLLPGEYTVHIESNGHQTKVVPNVIIPAGGAATLSVQLTPGGGHYADRIEIASVPDPSNLYANHTLTMAMLGAPDGSGCSIGRNGHAVMDLGPDSALHDLPGMDVRVFEGTEDAAVEGFQLYGGSSYLGPWTLIGTGTGTTSFDLAGSGLEEARYLRLVDDGDDSANDPFAGFEVDAIEALGATSSVPGSPDDPDVAGADGSLELRPFSPNPISAGSTLELIFDARAGERCRIDLIDMTGACVRTPVDGVVAQTDGSQLVRMDLVGRRGHPLRSGVYIVRLRGGGHVSVQKLVVVQ